jgi:hypothetical protein
MTAADHVANGHLVNILLFQSGLNRFQFFRSNDGNDKLHSHYRSNTYVDLGGCWAWLG